MDTALRAVTEGVRFLADAPCAVTTTLDGAGRPVDFATSFGKDYWTKAEAPAVSAGAW